MDATQVTQTDSSGFKYFYELVVGAILAAWLAFQGWLVTMLISHGRKIERLETAQISRADFERWKEEQQLQLDEVRASTIESNAECVRAVERSQEKLETSLTRAMDRVEKTNRELLVALAKRGLEQS